MRLGYRLSLALIAATFLVTTVYGVLAIREENKDLLNALKHETWITVATLQPAVEFALDRQDRSQVQELLDGLGHQRILGAAIYRPDGSVVVRSRDMPVVSTAPEPDPRHVIAEMTPTHAFIDLAGRRVFAYAVPLQDMQGRASAVLAIYHLTDYLAEDIRKEVRGLIISLLVGSVVSAGLVIFIVDRAVSRPIDRLIGQVTAIRRGEYQPADGGASDGGPAADGARRDELGRLAVEFDRMAADLARSREALMDEAEKRLQVERGLRRFDRMATLGQLTSNLAHEVGTPLGVLRGRAEFLAGEVADRPDARREIEIIIVQIDRITRTIERFLSASRSSPSTAERIVGDDLVRETAVLVDLECRRQGIRLQVEPAAGEDAVISGHRDGLMQVLLNLAVNGIQAMARGGELRLSSRRGELRGVTALEIEIADTGSGMSDEVKKRIFEPFYSTRGTTGLGLFISRNIVREHGGATTVESEPGRGTTFVVRLPMADGRGEAAAEAEAPAPTRAEVGENDKCHAGTS
jgi:signal transduction histidine kinase